MVISKQGDVTLLEHDHFSIIATGNHRVFKRRALKFGITGPADEIEWQVIDVEGVRLYIAGSHITVTKEDIYP